MRFTPGRVVVHRHFQRDRLAWVRVMRVVSDDDRGLLLWIAPGSPTRSLRADDGRTLRSMPFAEWITRRPVLAAGNWEGPGILKLIRPGAAHSVWWFWDDAGAFAGWYVNLEEPAVRWDDGDLAGLDIVDQDLDICVEPNRSWLWKDEHELTERLRFPDHYWVRDADAVWAEGRRVIPDIEAGLFPFDGTWCDFEPQPAWLTPPALPAGWDRARAYPDVRIPGMSEN
ncbi:DUF402 domain-containing protein [Planosporangium thailandense]|uniref:DUF402 domain-containing protein n=1 Tax=Planosporangium thailandense TaxID=765197 RepID=A0ABX0XQD4_9ACTN|nr:DUF402 domain-containing protein [Planosporangium thailandense]NJC68189.1 DUF402 domain-containing protein [Planosporangium thailandense]